MDKTDKQPVFEHRLGAIRVTIWENTDKSGSKFHSVTVVRRYKSGSDEWSNSNSYAGLSDLAHLMEAVALGREWLRLRLLSESVEG